MSPLKLQGNFFFKFCWPPKINWPPKFLSCLFLLHSVAIEMSNRLCFYAECLPFPFPSKLLGSWFQAAVLIPGCPTYALIPSQLVPIPTDSTTATSLTWLMWAEVKLLSTLRNHNKISWQLSFNTKVFFTYHVSYWWKF